VKKKTVIRTQTREVWVIREAGASQEGEEKPLPKLQKRLRPRTREIKDEKGPRPR
jgi:hypothetical protein